MAEVLTTEQFRQEFAARVSRLWFLEDGREQGTTAALAEFDAWLAEHDREVAEKARGVAREAAFSDHAEVRKFAARVLEAMSVYGYAEVQTTESVRP